MISIFTKLEDDALLRGTKIRKIELNIVIETYNRFEKHMKRVVTAHKFSRHNFKQMVASVVTPMRINVLHRD
jgi:hypothetical protein